MGADAPLPPNTMNAAAPDGASLCGGLSYKKTRLKPKGFAPEQ